MVVYPEVLVTPDAPTIKFHQPRELVDLEKELPRILHAQGWGVGTFFHVQFISHDKTKLLACAKFVVSEEVESVQTSDNQYSPMTKTVFSRKAEQIGDWWPVAPVVPLTMEEIVQDATERSAYVDPPLVHGPEITATEVLRRRGRPPKAAAA